MDLIPQEWTMIPEAKAYLDAMEGMRRALRRTIEGADSRCLNWNPLPGEANSLYAIVAHMCASEPSMVHRRITGESIEGSDHDAFNESGDDPHELFDLLDEMGQTTRSLMDGLTAEDLDRAIDPGGGRPPRMLREWIGIHIRHMANHLGHAEITRQFYEAGIVKGP